MPKCGNCKQDGMTVEHIRGCYSERFAGVATATVGESAVKYAEGFRPMAFMDSLPASKYALETPEGLKFYEIQIGKPGTRWDGYRFLSHLVGSPGDWAKHPVKGKARAELMAEISVDPRAAAVRYSLNFTVCAVCGSPLSDPESMARGLGPVCAERF